MASVTLSESQCTLKWVGIDLFDEFGLPNNDSGLRSTHELVSRKRDQVGAIAQRIPGQRFPRQVQLVEIYESSAAQVEHEGNASLF